MELYFVKRKLRNYIKEKKLGFHRNLELFSCSAGITGILKLKLSDKANYIVTTVNSNYMYFRLRISTHGMLQLKVFK